MARVLVVDDNEENLYFLKALCDAARHEAILARNGAEAIEHALGHPPDIIVSDILMPGMDGFTLCRRWRAEPSLAAIPFVFYTATYTDPKDREFGLRLGADEFLVKPIEPDTLLAAINGVLHQKRDGKTSTIPFSPPAESAVLREYNATLIRKLEDKLVQLEKSNQSLAVAEEYVRTILDTSPLPIIVADVEGKITFVNPAFATDFGYSLAEAIGSPCWDLIGYPGPTSESASSEGQPSEVESGSAYVRCRRKDGSVLETELFQAPLQIRQKTIGSLAIYRDVTEKRMLEEQLRQAQKLEAVGQLAAGVAHDFNNLLSVMAGYSELILLGAEPHSQVFHHADQISRACSRAGALTKQLLAFSRRHQVALPQVISPGALLEEMASMLRRVTRENIDLVVSVSEPVGQVVADPVQLEQIVLNLVTNACDAMPEGGRLSIGINNVPLDDRLAASGIRTSREYVRLAVTDTGTGMDPATRERIFEPFFTTKPIGAGTGLGLSSVYTIVQRYDGTIRVSSELGAGSCFEVFLPIAESSAAAAVRRHKDHAAGGGEAILLSEDDDAVRALICEVLSGLGYRVVAASSAADASQKIQDLGSHFDLLVTDVVMPRMSGRELARLAWSVRPNLHVLYVSGYEDESRPSAPEPTGKSAFLAKPFSQTQLAEAVRRILDDSE